MEDKTFDIYKSKTAQAEYCAKTGAPHFAPKSGVCWSCNKNIYEELPKTFIGITGQELTVMRGVSVEEASTTLVTGCPHCNRSYCD